MDMSLYLKFLKPFFAWRSPEYMGAKLIHSSAKKPNYVIYRGLIESGGKKYIKIYLPKKDKEVRFLFSKGWYLWESLSDMKKKVVEEEKGNDVVLVEDFLQSINILMVEYQVDNPYLIADKIGIAVLDSINHSVRKDEVFQRIKNV